MSFERVFESVLVGLHVEFDGRGLTCRPIWGEPGVSLVDQAYGTTSVIKFQHWSGWAPPAHKISVITSMIACCHRLSLGKVALNKALRDGFLLLHCQAEVPRIILNGTAWKWMVSHPQTIATECLPRVLERFFDVS